MKHIEDIHLENACPKDGLHEVASERIACGACCRTDGLALLHAAQCLRCQRGLVTVAMEQERRDLETGLRIKAALEGRKGPE